MCLCTQEFGTCLMIPLALEVLVRGQRNSSLEAWVQYALAIVPLQTDSETGMHL